MSDAKKGASEQLERFKEAARALGCDEDEAAFDEKLKVLTKNKSKPTLSKSADRSSLPSTKDT